jgi:hypothetical protein
MVLLSSMGSSQGERYLFSCIFHSLLCSSFALLECVDIIQNENGWDDISSRVSVWLARLLNDEIYLNFLSSFHSVLLHMDVLYNTLQKVSCNAVSVHKDIQVAMNNILANLPQVNGNSEPSTTRV